MQSLFLTKGIKYDKYVRNSQHLRMYNIEKGEIVNTQQRRTPTAAYVSTQVYNKNVLLNAIWKQGNMQYMNM